MVHGLNDEKDLVLLSLVAGVFILVTLSSTIGAIYFAMAATFAIMLGQGRHRIIQFAKSEKTTNIAVYGLLLAAVFVAVGSIVLGGQEAFVKATTFFASSFLTNFTIDNPVVKLFVFGFFIPVVETLFFYNVVYKFILDKARAKNDLRDMNTLVVIAVVAGIATAFHFTVRLLNDQALLGDLVFFGLSGAFVASQKETSGAAFGHVLLNTYFVGTILGLFPKLI